MVVSWVFTLIIIIVLIFIAKKNWDSVPQKLAQQQASINMNNRNFIIAIAAALIFQITGIPYLVLLMFYNNEKNAKLAKILRIINIIVLGSI